MNLPPLHELLILLSSFLSKSLWTWLWHNGADIIQSMSSNQVSPPPGRRGSAIIFDSATQTVSTKKHKHVDGDWNLCRDQNHSFLTRVLGSRVIKSQTVPKWRSHVNIYVGEAEETQRLAATLNLDKLGWTTSMKRLCGKFSHIYVVEDSRTLLHDSWSHTNAILSPGSRIHPTIGTIHYDLLHRLLNTKRTHNSIWV